MTLIPWSKILHFCKSVNILTSEKLLQFNLTSEIDENEIINQCLLQIRKAAVYISVNQYFDYLVMLTILANCAFLAMTEPINEAE